VKPIVVHEKVCATDFEQPEVYNAVSICILGSQLLTIVNRVSKTIKKMVR
jgi:hypothetical protein